MLTKPEEKPLASIVLLPGPPLIISRSTRSTMSVSVPSSSDEFVTVSVAASEFSSRKSVPIPPSIVSLPGPPVTTSPDVP